MLLALLPVWEGLRSVAVLEIVIIIVIVLRRERGVGCGLGECGAHIQKRIVVVLSLYKEIASAGMLGGSADGQNTTMDPPTPTHLAEIADAHVAIIALLFLVLLCLASLPPRDA